jgi:hypothetical protein
MHRICMVGALVALPILGAHGAHAQGVAESAATNSNSAIATQSVKEPSTKPPKLADQNRSYNSPAAMGAKVPSPKTASPTSQNHSPFLMERTGPPPDEVNRKKFENDAGQEAGKLLLRSVPSGADVFINNLLVGRTPLLMLIAPGKYEIAMRGQRQESAHRSVGLMPKETQTVVIHLVQRYPTSISIH